MPSHEVSSDGRAEQALAPPEALVDDARQTPLPDTDPASLVEHTRREVQQTVAESPDAEQRTHELVARAYVRLRNFKAALSEFEIACVLGASIEEREWLDLVEAFRAGEEYGDALRALDHTSRVDMLLDFAFQAFLSGDPDSALAAWQRCKRHGLELPEAAVRALTAYGRRVGDIDTLEQAQELLNERVVAADYIRCGDAILKRWRQNDNVSWSESLRRAADAYALARAPDRLLALLDKFRDVPKVPPDDVIAVLTRVVTHLAAFGVPLPRRSLAVLADAFLARGTPRDVGIGREIYTMIAKREHA